MKFRTTLVLAVVLAPPMATALAETKSDPSAILTIQDENSSISAAKLTDRFYTNGLRVNWTSPTGDVPGFLSRLANSLWGNGQQRIGFGISQQIYTPADTQSAVPNPHDRPYAGYLSGNISLLSDTDSDRSLLLLSLGVIGPGAGGEGLQNGFHDLIGQDHNRGWSHQIPNSAAIELLHERTWRLPIASFGGLDTDALPSLTVGVGTVRDYIQTGISFRIGQGLDSDFGVPRVRPGLSGGDVYVPTRPFAWYVFVGADGQAVGYDMLLDAAPFRSGPHVSSIWDVAELQGGVAVMAYGMRFTFAYVAQTQEFKNQTGGLHQFGSASLSLRF
jgi:lipid A 3-O-deacylase